MLPLESFGEGVAIRLGGSNSLYGWCGRFQGNFRNDSYLADVPQFGRHFLLAKKPSYVRRQKVSGGESCEGKAPEESQALRSVNRRGECGLLTG